MLFDKSVTIKAQQGVTGLETAIILIAFVVAAQVFAITVLSTGMFASERSKETAFSGLGEAKTSIDHVVRRLLTRPIVAAPKLFIRFRRSYLT